MSELGTGETGVVLLEEVEDKMTLLYGKNAGVMLRGTGLGM